MQKTKKSMLLSIELHRKLKIEAVKRDMSMISLVEDAIEKYIDKDFT